MVVELHLKSILDRRYGMELLGRKNIYFSHLSKNHFCVCLFVQIVSNFVFTISKCIRFYNLSYVTHERLRVNKWDIKSSVGINQVILLKITAKNGFIHKETKKKNN